MLGLVTWLDASSRARKQTVSAVGLLLALSTGAWTNSRLHFSLYWVVVQQNIWRSGQGLTCTYHASAADSMQQLKQQMTAMLAHVWQSS